MKRHRIVLIGHGGISKAYRNAFASIPGAEIAAVVGRNSEKAAAYAREYGIPVHGTDLAEAVARAQATAAVICAPNAAHYEGVMGASRLGLHCPCEKPREMIASCKRHGVQLAVSYMRRFIKHMRYLKDLDDSGTLGRILSVDVTHFHAEGDDRNLRHSGRRGRELRRDPRLSRSRRGASGIRTRGFGQRGVVPPVGSGLRAGDR